MRLPPTAPADDAALVRRLIRGEDAAFDAFFETHFPRLFRFAARRLDDADAIEEVVQATLAKALRRIHTWRGEAALFTWLCTICRHELADRARRASSGPRLVALDDAPAVRAAVEALAVATDTPEDQLARRELATLVHLTLDALPGRYGDVLEWKYVHGLTMAEIAERLGATPKAVESQLSRARAAFREGFATLRASYGHE
ncbi:MAG: sigma-70 family RNA polymerase sigma factor [Vicinamibacterales bacterium]